MEGHWLVAGVDEVDDAHGLVVILRNSLSSAASHIALIVGELFLWKPTLTALRRNDSSWSRWAAFVNPHHAEEAYCIASRWPWLGALSAVTGRDRRIHAILVPGARIMTGQMNWWRMRRALASRSCCSVWLRWFLESSHVAWRPGMMGTSVVPRERGFLNIISWDFDLFSDNLFSLAHCCMCSSSRSRVWALDAGMTKLESFPAVFGRRSVAVTMYANGPRPEPWMTLASMCGER